MFTKNNRLFQAASQSKIILPVFISLLMAVLFIIVGQILGIVLINPLLLVFSNFPDGGIFALLFSFITISLLVFLWVKLVEKREISTLGFFKEHALRDLLVGWLVGFLLFSLVLGLMVLFGFSKAYTMNISTSSILALIISLGGWFIQGGTEEVVTRGWLMPVIGVRSNVPLAVILSGSIFGLLHLANAGVTFLSILNVSLFGIFMCLYALKFENIWGVCGVHAAWNCIQGSIFGLPVSGNPLNSSLFVFKSTGPDWLSGGQFGPEGSIFTTLVLGISCLIIIALGKKKLNKNSFVV